MYDQLRGDRAAARANVEALLEAPGRSGTCPWIGWSAVLRGWTVAADGDFVTGAAEIRGGTLTLHTQPAPRYATPTTGRLADTLRRAGRYDEALATLDEADRLVQANEERFWESELLRVRGEVALQRGDLEGAAEYLAPRGRDRSTSGGAVAGAA